MKLTKGANLQESEITERQVIRMCQLKLEEEWRNNDHGGCVEKEFRAIQEIVHIESACSNIHARSESESEIVTTSDSFCKHMWREKLMEPEIDDSESSILYEKKHHVRFGTVEVVELFMTLGDHPECTHGPAVCLSSNVFSRGKYEIDDFQFQKLQQGKNKTRRDLHLSVADRRRM